jgi:hypothetical protein
MRFINEGAKLHHTQFFNPVATQNAVTFGRVTAAADPRIFRPAGRLPW